MSSKPIKQHKECLLQAYTVLIAFELEHKLQSTRTHDRMAGSDSDDSGFGDELAMTSTQTARTGCAGAGAPAALVAVGGKTTKITGANGMVQVRAARMLVVHTYDLSTDVG
jgi:hypothetical protein